MMKRGRLWDLVKERTSQAIRQGALQSIPSRSSYIEDGGVRFLVRLAANLNRKAEDKRRRMEKERVIGKGGDPFLPYEEDLFVCDLTESHLVLLNKFNVVEHHLLMVTRHFEHQETLLTREDFEAVWLVLPEYQSLAFYNGGEAAGASQTHKHLQLVPLPLAGEGPPVPIESLIDMRLASAGTVCRWEKIPFRHYFAWLDADWAERPVEASALTKQIYDGLMQRARLSYAQGHPRDSWQAGPYNLLMTPRWMMVIPRSREFFEGISVNSIGFAGALLVKNQNELDRVRSVGPWFVLNQVATEWDGSSGS